MRAIFSPTLRRTLQRSALTCFGMLIALVAVLAPAHADSLVTYAEASRHGLQRSWVSQVRVDPARHRVAKWLLDRGQLFALTTDGTVDLLDAETGKTLWVAQVGSTGQVATGIAVNAERVALLSATRLHILDRSDGRLLWSRPLGGAPSAAPAMGDRYAFVALLNGRVEGYDIEDPSAPAWQYQSSDRIYQSPTATGSVVSWSTSRGRLYVGQADIPRVLFRIETDKEIVTAPSERSPYLFVASLDGYLYCFNERNGSELWRYSTGYAVTSDPAIVGNLALVASEGPSLHAVDTTTGRRLWRVDGAAQFVTLGHQHAYALDRFGTLMILDPQTGGLAGRLATNETTSAIVNDQSDRIFLVNDRGLVQCLYEIGADEPTFYRESTLDADSGGEKDGEKGHGEDHEKDVVDDHVPADASPFQPAPADEDSNSADPLDEDNPFNF